MSNESPDFLYEHIKGLTTKKVIEHVESLDFVKNNSSEEVALLKQYYCSIQDPYGKIKNENALLGRKTETNNLIFQTRIINLVKKRFLTLFQKDIEIGKIILTLSSNIILITESASLLDRALTEKEREEFTGSLFKISEIGKIGDEDLNWENILIEMKCMVPPNTDYHKTCETFREKRKIVSLLMKILFEIKPEELWVLIISSFPILNSFFQLNQTIDLTLLANVVRLKEHTNLILHIYSALQENLLYFFIKYCEYIRLLITSSMANGESSQDSEEDKQNIKFAKSQWKFENVKDYVEQLKIFEHIAESELDSKKILDNSLLKSEVDEHKIFARIMENFRRKNEILFANLRILNNDKQKVTLSKVNQSLLEILQNDHENTIKKSGIVKMIERENRLHNIIHQPDELIANKFLFYYRKITERIELETLFKIILPKILNMKVLEIEGNKIHMENDENIEVVTSNLKLFNDMIGNNKNIFELKSVKMDTEMHKLNELFRNNVWQKYFPLVEKYEIELKSLISNEFKQKLDMHQTLENVTYKIYEFFIKKIAETNELEPIELSEIVSHAMSVCGKEFAFYDQDFGYFTEANWRGIALSHIDMPKFKELFDKRKLASQEVLFQEMYENGEKIPEFIRDYYWEYKIKEYEAQQSEVIYLEKSIERDREKLEELKKLTREETEKQDEITTKIKNLESAFCMLSETINYNTQPNVQKEYLQIAEEIDIPEDKENVEEILKIIMEREALKGKNIKKTLEKYINILFDPNKIDKVRDKLAEIEKEMMEYRRPSTLVLKQEEITKMIQNQVNVDLTVSIIDLINLLINQTGLKSRIIECQREIKFFEIMLQLTENAKYSDNIKEIIKKKKKFLDKVKKEIEHATKAIFNATSSVSFDDVTTTTIEIKGETEWNSAETINNEFDKIKMRLIELKQDNEFRIPLSKEFDQHQIFNEEEYKIEREKSFNQIQCVTKKFFEITHEVFVGLEWIKTKYEHLCKVFFLKNYLPEGAKNIIREMGKVVSKFLESIEKLSMGALSECELFSHAKIFQNEFSKSYEEILKICKKFNFNPHLHLDSLEKSVKESNDRIEADRNWKNEVLLKLQEFRKHK